MISIAREFGRGWAFRLIGVCFGLGLGGIAGAQAQEASAGEEGTSLVESLWEDLNRYVESRRAEGADDRLDESLRNEFRRLEIDDDAERAARRERLAEYRRARQAEGLEAERLEEAIRDERRRLGLDDTAEERFARRERIEEFLRTRGPRPSKPNDLKRSSGGAVASLESKRTRNC
jgi:hypothetical protein